MSGYISGIDRNQITMYSLEDMVNQESMVRVIDRFIDVTDLQKLGFAKCRPAETGRPAYPPKAMCKLYVYGYENGIRSSRKLERETLRNIEVMWLTDSLTPDYKTISEFRRENLRPLQKLFREFVKLCKSWDLIGGELFAIDGTKIKASNNKKNNFSRKKIDDRLAHIDEKINGYLAEMDLADKAEESDRPADTAKLQRLLEQAANNTEPQKPSDQAVDTLKPQKPSDQTGDAAKLQKLLDQATDNIELKKLLERKEQYEDYKKQLDKNGDNELSTVDPDARLMGNNRGGVDVAYNIQSAVDAKNDIIVEYDVSMNPSDQHQLSNMARKVKRTLKIKRFTTLADKGYYNGEDLLKVKRCQVTAIVARQKPSDSKSLPEKFRSEHFVYNEPTDTYTCPMGHTLCTPNRTAAKRHNYFNKVACASCPHKADCVEGATQYRRVTRSQYSKVYEETDRLHKDNMDLYRRRQQIVEHPFGTIKHTMNGRYFLVRTRRKVRTEVALLFLGYNRPVPKH